MFHLVSGHVPVHPIHPTQTEAEGTHHVSRTRSKGTAWETTITTYLQSRGWLNAERRTPNGRHDRGDIAGVVGVCIEAKNAARIDLAGWLDEAHLEAGNANAPIGAVWFKRRGRTDAGAGYVLIDGRTFTQLLQEAGYQ